MRRAAVLTLIGLFMAAVVARQPLLTAIGGGLVERDPVGPSDVIVVLAGNSPYRARHAEILYQQGLAPRVIISNEPLSSHGVQTTWLELRQYGLVHLAIPDDAIVPIPEIS